MLLTHHRLNRHVASLARLPIVLGFASALLGSTGLRAEDSLHQFTLSSPQIIPGEMMALAQVFNGMGCRGKNESPALNWTDPPAGTRSLALTVYDPDAPTGSGWWHWIVINLPPSLRKLPLKAGDPQVPNLPPGAMQIRTDAGHPGYGGPCPPVGHGPHRYWFRLYALKKTIEAQEDTPAAQVGFQISHEQLAVAELLGRFAR